MFRRMLRHVSYANVMATLAFFIALSGGAYAAIKIPAHSVGTRQLKPASVGPKQIKPGAVGPRQLKRQSILLRHLKRTTVRQLTGGAARLAPGSVKAEHLAENSVGPNALQGNAVGPDQLAPNAVGERHVMPGSLLLQHFAADQVSPRLFAHGSSGGSLGVNSGNVSLQRESKGIYLYTFTRSLRGCVPVSNVGFGHNPGVIGAGGTAQASLVGDNSVRVTVYRNGFTFNNVEDSDHNLIVLC